MPAFSLPDMRSSIVPSVAPWAPKKLFLAVGNGVLCESAGPRTRTCRVEALALLHGEAVLQGLPGRSCRTMCGMAAGGSPSRST